MKLIYTSVTTRPNTDIEFWDINSPYSSPQTLQQEMLADGRIISITNTISEDQLTSTTVKIFASINDFVYSQSHATDYSDIEEYFRKEVSYFEYMFNNGLTETHGWVFEA